MKQIVVYRQSRGAHQCRCHVREPNEPRRLRHLQRRLLPLPSHPPVTTTEPLFSSAGWAATSDTNCASVSSQLDSGACGASLAGSAIAPANSRQARGGAIGVCGKVALLLQKPGLRVARGLYGPTHARYGCQYDTFHVHSNTRDMWPQWPATRVLRGRSGTRLRPMATCRGLKDCPKARKRVAPLTGVPHCRLDPIRSERPGRVRPLPAVASRAPALGDDRPSPERAEQTDHTGRRAARYRWQ
jgi:hypothetical protein